MFNKILRFFSKNKNKSTPFPPLPGYSLHIKEHETLDAALDLLERKLYKR